MKYNNGNIYMKKMKLTRIERESEIDCGKKKKNKKATNCLYISEWTSEKSRNSFAQAEDRLHGITAAE